MNVPEWTAEAPTEPGLYWFCLIESEASCTPPRHCSVVEDAQGRLVLGVRNEIWERPIPADVPHRVWAGPLRFPVGKAVFTDRLATKGEGETP